MKRVRTCLGVVAVAALIAGSASAAERERTAQSPSDQVVKGTTTRSTVGPRVKIHIVTTSVDKAAKEPSPATRGESGTLVASGPRVRVQLIASGAGKAPSLPDNAVPSARPRVRVMISPRGDAPSLSPTGPGARTTTRN